MSINIPECIALCRQVGFPEHSIPIAVSVAKCESGLNPNSHCLNCVPGFIEDSRGLWQINVLAHPKYNTPTIYDPLKNAQAALDISSNGTNWQPWSTFTNGCYEQYLVRVTEAMQAPIAVAVNGTTVPDAEGYVLNGRSFGWVRPISIRLQAQIVDYNSSSVTLKRAGTERTLAATIQNSQAFVHLADFRQFPGVAVNYDGPTNTVNITF